MPIIRKLKEKLKNITEKTKKIKPLVKAAKKVSQKTTKRIAFAKEIKKEKKQAGQPVKEVLGSHETFVEKTKFFTATLPKVSRPLPKELSLSYGEQRILLQVRDPWWLYTYWEILPGTWDSLKQRLGEIYYSAKRILRVYDVSHIIFDGTNAHRFFDIEVRAEIDNWYIETGAAGRSWCVDYGLRLPNGEFITIVRSNVVESPIDGPSSITDEEWMVPEEIFGRLYGLGFGWGKSSPGKGWQERVRKELFSGVLASPGMASMASPVKKLAKERKFWLVVDCELIVYGATEPDAKVSVQGKEIKLRPDGTFTLRFALPDGKQTIPVKAVSNDKIEERTITPIVIRDTRYASFVKETV